MSAEKNSDKPLVTLDLCGLNCPAPLLGAKHVIDDLRPGQVMQLISDCPGTPDDLFAWSRHTGNEVIGTDSSADAGSHTPSSAAAAPSVRRPT